LVDLNLIGEIESNADDCDSIDKCQVKNTTIIESDSIHYLASNSSSTGKYISNFNLFWLNKPFHFLIN